MHREGLRPRPACPGGAVFDYQKAEEKQILFAPVRLARPVCPGGAVFDNQKAEEKQILFAPARLARAERCLTTRKGGAALHCLVAKHRSARGAKIRPPINPFLFSLQRSHSTCHTEGSLKVHALFTSSR